MVGRHARFALGLGRLRPRLATVAGAAALLTACSSGVATARVISVDGRIGPLRIDHSDAAAVIAFAGRPAAERRGRIFGSRAYRAFGYGCATISSDVVFPIVPGGPYCRTIFYLNPRTDRLATFFTTSPRYSEDHGVHIGMRTAEVERLLHKRLYRGCEEDIYLGSPTATLTIAFLGGIVRKEPAASGLHVTGGGVYALTFAVNNPQPTLSSLSPASVIAGSGAFTLTLNGTNFIPASVVQVNGSNRTTTFVSSTRLTATIPASDVASASFPSISVLNPGPGGGVWAITLGVNNR